MLHERNVILTVRIANTPRVPDGERLEIAALPGSFTLMIVTFGYIEEPNIPKVLANAGAQGFEIDMKTTSFFLSRRTFQASSKIGLPLWQDYFYITMARSATDASSFYKLPTNRVLELGQQFIV